MYHIHENGEFKREELPSLKGDAKFDFGTIYDKSNSVFIIGGCHKDLEGKSDAVKTCQKFNIFNQKFEKLPELNQARINPSCFITK